MRKSESDGELDRFCSWMGDMAVVDCRKFCVACGAGVDVPLAVVTDNSGTDGDMVALIRWSSFLLAGNGCWRLLAAIIVGVEDVDDDEDVDVVDAVDGGGDGVFKFCDDWVPFAFSSALVVEVGVGVDGVLLIGVGGCGCGWGCGMCKICCCCARTGAFNELDFFIWTLPARGPFGVCCWVVDVAAGNDRFDIKFDCVIFVFALSRLPATDVYFGWTFGWFVLPTAAGFVK